MTRELYIGLMSGTSLDGVDGVLIDLAPGAGLQIVAHRHAPYGPDLRQELLSLNQPGDNEVHRSALAANAVAELYATVVEGLLAEAHVHRDEVRAIGAHGQTVRHRPLEFDGVGYTVQLLNGPLLAERSSLPVACDFRSRDIAAGGQGAPLVPAFHRAAFSSSTEDTAVLNIGGFANVTLLPANGDASGHDCGPGNVLLDLWSAQHTGQAYDSNGNWGRSGQLNPLLLDAMLRDPFIQKTPPKSTGRDYFNAAWLNSHLAGIGTIAAVDVQCTLTHFTACAAAHSIHRELPQAQRLLVCGGGALNGFLMECLASALPQARILRIDEATALHPMHVEAAAFAWLAQARVAHRTANLPAVTGASGHRVLGALHFA